MTSLVTGNTGFPWVSCNGSKNWVDFTCFDPPWENNCTKEFSAQLGDILCCVSLLVFGLRFSYCGHWEDRDKRDNLTLAFHGLDTQPRVNQQNKARERHSPAPARDSICFRYSDTFQITFRILSAAYVGRLWWLEWATCLNLEKEILVNKVFSLLVLSRMIKTNIL